MPAAQPQSTLQSSDNQLTAMYTTVRVLCDQPRGATLFVCEERATGELVVVKQTQKYTATSSDTRTGNRDGHVVVVPSEDQPPIVIALAQDSIHQERRVVQILRDHPHNNIVHFLPTSSCLLNNALVMEYCPRGDLFSLLEQQPRRYFDETDAMRYFRNIVDGVRHLHSLDTAHRDLSLENVLLNTQGHAKICDFGLSARASVMAGDCVGKLQYMAPEVACGTRQYDPVVADVWSLGIMLFIMLTGSPLFAIAVPSDLAWPAMERVGVAGILGSWQMKDQISDETLTLLRDMLRTDPAQRLQTLEDVHARLS